MMCLYYTLVQPHLLYGLSITMWGSTSPSSSQKQLQLLQNNAVGAIVGCRKCDHISLSLGQVSATFASFFYSFGKLPK